MPPHRRAHRPVDDLDPQQVGPQQHDVGDVDPEEPPRLPGHLVEHLAGVVEGGEPAGEVVEDGQLVGTTAQLGHRPRDVVVGSPTGPSSRIGRASGSPASGDDLARVEDAVRVERPLDGAMHVHHGGGQLGLQAVALEQAHAVLAGDGAAERERLGDDLLEGAWARSRAASSPGGVMISGCRLPSPAWAMLAMMTSCRSPIAWIRASISGTAAQRHADVLGEDRAEPLERGVGEAAGGEQSVGLGVVVRPGGPGRAGRLEAREHGLGLGVAGGARLVDPGEQDGLAVGLDAEVLPLVDGREAVAVDQLERRRDQAGAGDGRDGLPGSDEGVEVAGDGVLGRAGRAQPDGDLGDDAEGALGADEQRRRGRSRRRPWRSGGRAGRARPCR